MCWGVLLNHNPRHVWLVIMTEYAVYLDASGSPDDQPYVLVAGFLATENQWLTFEPEWKKLLKKYDLGEVFHMTDFEARKRKDRGIILDALTDVINAHTKAHFSCSVKMEAYRKVNETYALEESIGNSRRPTTALCNFNGAIGFEPNF